MEISDDPEDPRADSVNSVYEGRSNAKRTSTSIFLCFFKVSVAWGRLGGPKTFIFLYMFKVSVASGRLGNQKTMVFHWCCKVLEWGGTAAGEQK